MEMQFVRIKVKPSFAKFAKVPVVLDGWIFSNGQSGNNVQFYGHVSVDHVEVCSICGRELTDPISVATGIGPICAKSCNVDRPSLAEWSDSAAEALKQEIVASTTKVWSLPRFGKKGQPLTTFKTSTVEPRVSHEDAMFAAQAFLAKSTPPQIVPVKAEAVENGGKPAGRVWLHDGFVYAQTPYALKEVCKNIPERQWDPAAKSWKWNATPKKARQVLEALKGQGLVADPAVIQLASYTPQLV